MNSLEKFKRHIGEPIDIKIGEDIFKFKPLNYEQFGKLMVIGSKFKAGEDFDVSKLDQESVQAMLDLFFNIVKASADTNVPDDDLRQFVASNMDSFGDILDKLTPKMEGRDNIVQERIKQMKNARLVKP